MRRYADRYEAGRALAEELTAYRGLGKELLVLGLPRGGVPVACEVARALGDAPLDVFLVRKLGVPGHEELAMGAVASGGVRVLNDVVVRSLNITDAEVEEVTQRERAELARRERLYRDARPFPPVEGRTVLLVDDGLATGTTMRAAVRALRTMRPARLVVAVPVASPDSCEELRTEVEDIVCARTPDPLLAVGIWYDDFSQTSDDEVRGLLLSAAERGAHGSEHPREEQEADSMANDTTTARQPNEQQRRRPLDGRTVAILVADGFEQVEMTEPKRALEEAGAQTRIVSPAAGRVQGWDSDNKADTFPVDISLDEADAEAFDALLLPGGVKNPDRLRTMAQAVSFTRAFFEQNKPVAAICHGPWTLIEAGVLRGRTVTSWPSLKTDLQNAGANWLDQEVVNDNGLVTSRKPDDLPAFNAKMVEEFAEGFHAQGQNVAASREGRRQQPQQHERQQADRTGDELVGSGNLGLREPKPGELDASDEDEMTEETVRGGEVVAKRRGES